MIEAMPIIPRTTQHSLPIEDPNHEISNLPPEIWHDDNDPVAQTARKYERAIKSINRALQPLPMMERLTGYVAGAAVGLVPAALSYGVSHAIGKGDSKAAEVVTHFVLTAGVITGTHMAHEIMMKPQEYRQTKETSELLSDARKQARTSYAESITEERNSEPVRSV